MTFHSLLLGNAVFAYKVGSALCIDTFVYICTYARTGSTYLVDDVVIYML